MDTEYTQAYKTKDYLKVVDNMLNRTIESGLTDYLSMCQLLSLSNRTRSQQIFDKLYGDKIDQAMVQQAHEHRSRSVLPSIHINMMLFLPSTYKLVSSARIMYLEYWKKPNLSRVEQDRATNVISSINDNLLNRGQQYLRQTFKTVRHQSLDVRLQ